MRPMARRGDAFSSSSSIAPLRRLVQCVRVSTAVTTPLLHQRAAFGLPPIEPLTHSSSPMLSNSYVDARHGGATHPTSSVSGSESHEQAKAFRFAVKNGERGLYDHGVSPEAKGFIAEAEAEYQASSAYLHNVPGGTSQPETSMYFDERTGQEVTTTRIAAPFGETYISSSKERFASRGHTGEMARQAAVLDKPYMLDEHAQLNLKKERQLVELLDSPMPAIAKANEVAAVLLESFYPQKLALQPRTGEAVVLLYSQASYLVRLEGPVGGEKRGDGKVQWRLASSAGMAPATITAQDIPFLDAMRRLYSHQKQLFVAPTPLLVEHMMTTLSVATAPSTAVFHLANRLLLDADRFVLLPTRSTYAAFFAVCQTNNAMSFALARYTDALQALQLSPDAPMLTSLLKGLNESGYVEEAVALLARTDKVAMSTPLLNACLETLLLSEQSLAVFSVYESMADSSVKPNAETFTLLLLACEKSNQWGRVTAVLADMQGRRVRGNEQTLNLLLKGLMQEKLHSFALQLHRTMSAKKVPVWPALASGMRRLS